jgi:hypothetical protein
MIESIYPYISTKRAQYQFLRLILPVPFGIFCLSPPYILFDHLQEQAELFESLYARVSVLSDSQLRQASDLLRRGNPQMIGLVKAYVGKEADEASKKQFKRVLMTLFG